MSYLAKFLLAITVLWSAWPGTLVQACSICYGGDEKSGDAVNGAIFVMLGALAVVIGSIVAVGISIARRSRHLPAHLVEHSSLLQDSLL